MSSNSFPVVSSFFRSIEGKLSEKKINRLKRLVIDDYEGFLAIVREWQAGQSVSE